MQWLHHTRKLDNQLLRARQGAEGFAVLVMRINITEEVMEQTLRWLTYNGACTLRCSASTLLKPR